MKDIIICDIDGTIANIDHRVHHLKSKPVDWAAFYKDAGDDKPIREMTRALTALWTDFGVRFITARSENERDMTRLWLMRHGLNFGEVFMRANGDTRCDAIVKVELAAERGLTPDRVAFVLEDRTRCVKAWRAAGYRCLQVAEGEF